MRAFVPLTTIAPSFSLATLVVLLASITAVVPDVYVKQFKPDNRFISVKRYSSDHVQGTPPLHRSGMGGWLIYARPDATACSSTLFAPTLLRRNMNDSDSSMSWILMAKAGNCSLGVKMAVARKLGFSALIIHSMGRESLSVITALPTPTHWPLAPSLHVVTISASAATSLRKNYTFLAGKSRFVIYIDNSTNDNWFETHLSPFFHAMSAICCGITFFILFKRFRESWKNRHKKGIGLKNVNTIPTREYVAEDQFENCVICIEDFEPGETVKVLNCDHMYHPPCIDPWLSKRRNACPVCKRKAWRRPDTGNKANSLVSGEEAREVEDEEEDPSDIVSDDMSSEDVPPALRGLF